MNAAANLVDIAKDETAALTERSNARELADLEALYGDDRKSRASRSYRASLARAAAQPEAAREAPGHGRRRPRADGHHVGLPRRDRAADRRRRRPGQRGGARRWSRDLARRSTPEENIRRIDAIFAAREQMMEFNTTPLLALESMMVSLRIALSTGLQLAGDPSSHPWPRAASLVLAVAVRPAARRAPAPRGADAGPSRPSSAGAVAGSDPPPATPAPRRPGSRRSTTRSSTGSRAGDATSAPRSGAAGLRRPRRPVDRARAAEGARRATRTQRLGSLVVNPGGPGGRASTTPPARRRTSATPLLHALRHRRLRPARRRREHAGRVPAPTTQLDEFARRRPRPGHPGRGARPPTGSCASSATAACSAAATSPGTSRPSRSPGHRRPARRRSASRS